MQQEGLLGVLEALDGVGVMKAGILLSLQQGVSGVFTEPAGGVTISAGSTLVLLLSKLGIGVEE